MSDLNKSGLRRQCLTLRDGLDASYRQQAAEIIAERLLSVIPPAAKIVAGYVPIRNEVDVVTAMEALASEGHKLCLPVVAQQNQPLQFRRWRIGDELEKGMHGTVMPPASAKIVIPDAVIVPLVAFDAACHRLGYGAGYYDRTLEELRKAKPHMYVVGMAYSMQQIEHIPAEENDQRLDAIVTEKGIVIPA